MKDRMEKKVRPQEMMKDIKEKGRLHMCLLDSLQ